MKLKITAEAVRLLRALFTCPQTWTQRQPESPQTRYGVYFPGVEMRQSLWGLGARLKVRHVPEDCWTAGALLGVYPPGNDHDGGNSRGWRDGWSLVLWPLEAGEIGTMELCCTGPHWCKSHPGYRGLHSADPRVMVIDLPGTSGRCSQRFAIGPPGAIVERPAIGARGTDMSHAVTL